MLNKFSLKGKFIFSISITLISLIGVSLGSFMLMNNLFKDTTDVLKTKGFENISKVLNADRDFYQALVAFEQIVLTNPAPEKRESLYNDFVENSNQVAERMAAAKEFFESGDKNWLNETDSKGIKNITYFENLEKDFALWRENAENLMNNTSYNSEIEEKVLGTFDSVRDNIDFIGESIEVLTFAKLDDSNAVLSDTYKLIIAVDVFVITLFLILLIYNLIYIKKNISLISKSAEKLGAGEKDIYLNTSLTDEFSEINKSINKITDRLFWFEQILDTINSPISVIDNELKWTFINKSAEKLIGEKRQFLIGKACKKWAMSHCTGNNCSVICYEDRRDIPHLELNEKTYSIELSTLTDSKGKNTGFIEIFKDITSIERSMSYQKAEVKKLGLGLKKLAEGNLNFTNKVTPPDKYTQKDYENFVTINDSLENARSTLKTLLEEFSSTLESISSNNLDVEIKTEYKGFFDALKSGLNNIINNFNNILHEISRTAREVANGVNQVSDSSQQLSQGATEQASSIEELTTTISTINEQTTKNAENANETSKLANTAKENAIKGNSRMKTMLEAMEDINESSSNIHKIIKVIDEIAFQTNILSLNAAVEAARAGQHGKGFAVVADEVRNLASRSSHAANETTELIENTIKKVALGSKIAHETAEELSNIVDGIEKSAALSLEIAEASVQQASSISHITIGINQISEVTENNSALAQESAASSEELSSQAEILKTKVSRFNLKNNDKVLIEDVIKNNEKSIMSLIEKKDINDFDKF